MIKTPNETLAGGRAKSRAPLKRSVHTAMEFPEPRYSKRTQVARVARADAQQYGKLYLIKACRTVKLTHQIKLLTFHAYQEGLKLVISVKKGTQKHLYLSVFIRKHKEIIRWETTK